jgi:hypothetical protein
MSIDTDVHQINSLAQAQKYARRREHQICSLAQAWKYARFRPFTSLITSGSKVSRRGSSCTFGENISSDTSSYLILWY